MKVQNNTETFSKLINKHKKGKKLRLGELVPDCHACEMSTIKQKARGTFLGGTRCGVAWGGRRRS